MIELIPKRSVRRKVLNASFFNSGSSSRLSLKDQTFFRLSMKTGNGIRQIKKVYELSFNIRKVVKEAIAPIMSIVW